MQQSISVTILGRSYRLRVEEQHEDFTRRVAELVDARAQLVAAEAEGYPPLTHMALTALSLGEELLSARDELARLRPLETEADDLAARLDLALENGGARPAAPTAKPTTRKGKGTNPSRTAAVRTPTHTGPEEESSTAARVPGDAPPATEA